MVNYVFLGDSPTLETGFAKVVRNILARLDLPNKHLWGIGYNGLQHDYDYNIYPANINSHWSKSAADKQRFKEFLLNFEGDIVLWTVHDPYRLANFNNIIEEVRLNKNLKIISYLPIDFSGLDQESISFINKIDVPVCYTNFGKSVLEKNGINKKIFVIPHGNDPAFCKKNVNRSFYFPNCEDSILIGVVNSNSERKNLTKSLEILKILLKVDDRFKMYFHCPNEGFFNLKRVALQLGVLDNIIFGDVFFENQKIGKSSCDDETLVEINNCFDLFLSTSIGEGWGLTATEAASCEVPLILPNHTSFNEIFEEDECLFLNPSISKYYNENLCPDLIPEECALQIVNYLKSENIGDRVKKAKLKVDSFDWDLISKEWEALIKNS